MKALGVIGLFVYGWATALVSHAVRLGVNSPDDTLFVAGVFLATVWVLVTALLVLGLRAYLKGDIT
jgi:hypothetical protein